MGCAPAPAGPARTGGKGSKKGSKKGSSTPFPAERRRRAQTPQARARALLRVRTLTAPAHPYREWRRAHFTRHTRRHILEADGRPVLDKHGRPSARSTAPTPSRT
ncbi:hypothetical protein [Streptomyces californicus]|uniref:hypothetical protein n=1 Tax=Streptomyces californicus TaxID=67351 RepID=UPI00296EF2D8|nr:hypothetical protein [Streptomyces californicus]MDW4912520.1 hypothetical protein [Streptomyces californicus]